MTELRLAGLYVFAVAATLIAIWLGAGAVVGSLIILAFICTFASSSKSMLTTALAVLKHLKMGDK
jgi:hypothetical protein